MNVFELFAKLSLDSSEYESGLSDAENKGSSFGSGLRTATRVAGVAIAGATTAVIGFGKTAVDAGMDFDTSMSQVAATMGLTQEQMQEAGGEFEQLRDFAQEMGATTAFSATQSADALNYMALAGYNADTSIAMLPNVLNLAAAGSIDLARASDMITDAQSALGLTLDETSVMVDQMAAAASNSNTSVEQLGDAFLTIGATAANLQGGTNELATVLGVLADNGIKGAEGGTHLRNMILSLTNPTNTAGDLIEELGLNVYDAEGNMRSMVDIIYDLQQATEDMTQAQRDSVVGTIFNRTDMASVNALLATDVLRFDELSEVIGDSAGAAQTMADVQLDNLAGDITLFQSALEGAQIAVSDSLTPTLREFVQLGSEGLSSVTTAFQEGGLDGAMEALGVWLSEALGLIIDKTPEIVDAAIKLIGALGQGLIDNADSIADAALEVMQILVDNFLAVTDGDGLSELIDTAFSIIEKFGTFLVENAPALIEATSQVILKLVELLTDPENMEMMIDLALQLILAIADGLVAAMPQLAYTIPMIIGNLIITIVEEFPRILETLGALLGDLFLMVVGLIGGGNGMSYDEVMAGVEDVWNALIGWFEDIGVKFGEFVDGIVEFVVGLWDDIVENWSGGIDRVMEALGGWWDEISEWFSGLVDSALTWAGDLIDNFVSGITGGVDRVGSAVSGIADRVRNLIGFSEPEEGPLSDFHTYAPDMIDLFTQGIYDGQADIERAMNDVLSMPDITSNVSADVIGAGVQLNNNQPIVVQAYFGNDKFDEYVVNSNQRNNYISGGRA